MHVAKFKTANGQIIYDADLIRAIDAEVFAPEYWRSKDAVVGTASGRGQVYFVQSTTGNWAIRHYRRGGLIARLIADRYLYTGTERTRCFKEWRLLAALSDQGLPVPRPVAAQFSRQGLFYRADIITETLVDTKSLAEQMLTGVSPDMWFRIGACIARFHAARINHADLNAHNVLLSQDAVYLLDFDRGRREVASGRWTDSNLARLQRSIVKLSASGNEADKVSRGWQKLLEGYRDGCQE